MKNKHPKTEKLLNQIFFETPVLCLPIEKFNMLLKCLIPYAHPILYSICIGSGIQTTVKPNELSSVMTVRRYGSHKGAMAYMLQFGESTIHRIFVALVVFMSNILMLKSQT